MTDAYDAMVAKRSTRPIYLLTIEGLGDATNGQYKFCTRVPDYAVEAEDDAYKPLLVDVPSEVSTELKPFIGGVEKRNVLSFEMLDVQEYENDPGLLTRLSPTDADPIDTMLVGTRLLPENTWMRGEMVPPASDVFEEGMLLFINNECVKVKRIKDMPTRPLLEIERGMLGTIPRKHEGVVGIFTSNQVLKRRRVKLYATYDGLSSTDEKLLGSYRITSLNIDGATWSFGATTAQDMFDAPIYSSQTLLRGKFMGTGKSSYFEHLGTVTSRLEGEKLVRETETVVIEKIEVAEGPAVNFRCMYTENQDSDFGAGCADWWSDVEFYDDDGNKVVSMFPNGSYVTVGKEIIQGAWNPPQPVAAPELKKSVIAARFIVHQRNLGGSARDSGFKPDDVESWKLENKEFREAFITCMEPRKAPGLVSFVSEYNETEQENGPKTVVDVMVLTTDNYENTERTSFRYQKRGEETATKNATWHCSEHPVMIMLCLMCSAREPGQQAATGDAVALMNYTAGKGNFSGCRPGLGLGIPASDIDFDSFWKVFEADPTLRLANVCINEKQKFSKWVTEHILQPFGWCLMIIDEKVTLKVFKSGYGVNVEGVDIGVDDIVVDDNGAPKLQHDRAISDAVSSIYLHLEALDGEPPPVRINSTTFPQYYTSTWDDEDVLNELDIELKGSHMSMLESPTVLTRCGELLRRFNRPVDKVVFTTDMRFITQSIGSVFFLTVPWLVNFRTGTRGWTEVPMQVVKRNLNLKMGTIEWTCIAWLGERLKPIAPSVLINKVGDGVFETVTNAFGTSDDTFGSQKDTLAFMTGDIVRLLETDGTMVAGSSTSTVVSNEGGKLELSGDFGVKARNGMLISLAHSEDASEDMLANRAYLASRKTGVVQEGTSPARFGRPLLED